jgi:hypothetical protein
MTPSFMPARCSEVLTGPAMLSPGSETTQQASPNTSGIIVLSIHEESQYGGENLNY